MPIVYLHLTSRLQVELSLCIRIFWLYESRSKSSEIWFDVFSEFLCLEYAWTRYCSLTTNMVISEFYFILVFYYETIVKSFVTLCITIQMIKGSINTKRVWCDCDHLCPIQTSFSNFRVSAICGIFRNWSRNMFKGLGEKSQGRVQGQIPWCGGGWGQSTQKLSDFATLIVYSLFIQHFKIK